MLASCPVGGRDNDSGECRVPCNCSPGSHFPTHYSQTGITPASLNNKPKSISAAHINPKEKNEQILFISYQTIVLSSTILETLYSRTTQMLIGPNDDFHSNKADWRRRSSNHLLSPPIGGTLYYSKLCTAIC